MSDLIYIVSTESKEWSGWVNGRFWTIQKLNKHVKMFNDGYEFHYRFDLKDMFEIRRQLAAQIEKHELHTAN